jgi:hypothetical protein
MSLTYTYVRGILWPEECKLHATRSVTSALQRKKKGGVPSLQLTADYTREMAIQDAIAKKVSVGYDNWYPDYWFTFLTMGKPIGEDRCSPLFNSGMPTKEMPSGLGPSAALEEGSRDVRKMEHRKVMNAMASNSSVTSSNTSIGHKRRKLSVSSTSDDGALMSPMQEVAYQR